MVRADFPYCYVNSKKLAGGKYRDYWRWRRDGQDTALPGQPGEPAFHARYAELMHAAEQRANAQDTTPERHTFAWLCSAYLDSAEFNALSERTQDDYRDTIERRLVPVLGPERFDCIKRQHIKPIRDRLAKTHSARTAHKIKQTVSLLYTWAEDSDLLPDGFTNPAKSIRRIKGDSKPIEVWSPEEIALFLSKCAPAMRTPVLLALYTGQRREDLVRMEWSDYLGETIRVRQNKTGEPLTIPCAPALRRHLKPKRGISGAILRGADGKAMTAGQLSSAMNRAVAAIEGMPKRSLHGLRYAAAAELEAVGCTWLQIASIVGHRTYQMSRKYAEQRRAAEQAGAMRENASAE